MGESSENGSPTVPQDLVDSVAQLTRLVARQSKQFQLLMNSFAGESQATHNVPDQCYDSTFDSWYASVEAVPCEDTISWIDSTYPVGFQSHTNESVSVEDFGDNKDLVEFQSRTNVADFGDNNNKHEIARVWEDIGCLPFKSAAANHLKEDIGCPLQSAACVLVDAHIHQECYMAGAKINLFGGPWISLFGLWDRAPDEYCGRIATGQARVFRPTDMQRWMTLGEQPMKMANTLQVNFFKGGVTVVAYFTTGANCF